MPPKEIMLNINKIFKKNGASKHPLRCRSCQGLRKPCSLVSMCNWCDDDERYTVKIVLLLTSETQQLGQRPLASHYDPLLLQHPWFYSEGLSSNTCNIWLNFKIKLGDKHFTFHILELLDRY